VYVGAGSDVRPAESPENTEMPESNAEVLGLQGQLAAAHETITSLQASLETLKAQNSEATIAALRADVAARDASVASLTVEVDGLKAQVATLTGASAAVVARAEAAEAALAAANERIAAEAAERTQAARVALAVKAGATAEAAATLVENLKGLADDAFASTLEVVKASFVAPAPKAAATPAAIDNARPEKDAALASSADVDGEARSAAIASFFESTVLRTPAGRSQASN
jgi:colicin import membrane protein